jgi:hypothetical protein
MPADVLCAVLSVKGCRRFQVLLFLAWDRFESQMKYSRRDRMLQVTTQRRLKWKTAKSTAGGLDASPFFKYVDAMRVQCRGSPTSRSSHRTRKSFILAACFSTWRCCINAAKKVKSLGFVTDAFYCARKLRIVRSCYLCYYRATNPSRRGSFNSVESRQSHTPEIFSPQTGPARESAALKLG